MDNRMHVQRISWTPHCPLTILTVHFFWTCRAQNKMSFLIVVYVFLSLKILFEHILNIMEWKPRIALGRGEKKKLDQGFKILWKGNHPMQYFPFMLIISFWFLTLHPEQSALKPVGAGDPPDRRLQSPGTRSSPGRLWWDPAGGDRAHCKENGWGPGSFLFCRTVSQEKSVIRNLSTLSLKWHNMVERTGTLQSGSHTPLPPVSGCYN